LSIRFLIFSLPALLCCMVQIYARTDTATTVTITGRVVVSGSEQPASFIRIRELQSKKTVATDRRGYFRITISDVYKASLVVALDGIGFYADTLVLPAKDTDIVHGLREKMETQSEVVVSAEDPARSIMKRVVARKLLQEKKLKSYTYMLYTKFVAATDTTTALRSTGRGDSTIVSILESFSKGYYKYPDNYYNEILQRRQTVNVPTQANSVTFGTNLNVYSNSIQILGETIETPFADNVLEMYDLVLQSALDDDIAKIAVSPKSSLHRAFRGVIYIDLQTYSPVEVSLIPSEEVNLPFDADLTYRQNFQIIDSMVVPEALSIESSLEASLFWVIAPRLDINIETICYDYTINPEIEDYLFDQRRVEILLEANIFDSTYWRMNSKLPLRPEEERAYQEINSFINNPDSIENSLINRYLGPVRQALAKLRQPPFTGFDDILRYNSIHGLYMGLGIEHSILGVFDTRLTGGYGVNDKRWYYVATVSVSLDRREKLRLLVGHCNDLLRRDNPNVVRQNFIAATSLLFGNDYGDYYYSERSHVGLTYGWGQYRFIGRDQFIRPSNIALRYQSSFDQTAYTSDFFHLLPRKDSVRQNPPVHNGRIHSLVADLQLDFFPTRRIARQGMQISYELANKDLLGGTATYSVVNWQGFFRTPTLPLWTLDVTLGATWSWGSLPPQRFFSTETGIRSIVVNNAFRGMQVKEFYGDRSFTATFSHNFGELVPGVFRIPNVASFGLEFILFGGFAWTDFSNATRALYSPALSTTAETPERYYYEAGISINRLLIFLRLDLNTRLSQRDRPEFRVTLSNALF